jgi:hypothetical protein
LGFGQQSIVAIFQKGGEGTEVSGTEVSGSEFCLCLLETRFTKSI